MKIKYGLFENFGQVKMCFFQDKTRTKKDCSSDVL